MSGERLTVEELAAIIAARRASDPEASYTAKLLADGIERCARKFGEEAIETMVAALSRDKAALRGEAADLIYHLLVLLAAAGVDLDDIYAELGRRAGVSGHDEKAMRSR
jgi:phosphoribosyl-ATP pyrophosphohydrolase